MLSVFKNNLHSMFSLSKVKRVHFVNLTSWPFYNFPLIFAEGRLYVIWRV